MNKANWLTTIRQHLDQGLEQLPQERSQQLFAIRQQALANHRQQGTWLQQTWLRPALATLALALLVGGSLTYWQDQGDISEVATLDSELLVDDLPPDAFTDPGFRTWLKESSEG